MQTVEDKIKNLEFKIAFTETNIRYLLGENPRNEALIEQHRKTIEADKKEIESLNKK